MLNFRGARVAENMNPPRWRTNSEFFGHVLHKLLSYPALVCEIKSSTQKIRCSALMAILNRHSKHGHQPANIILMFLSAGQPTLKRLSQAAVQFFVIF